MNCIKRTLPIMLLIFLLNSAIPPLANSQEVVLPGATAVKPGGPATPIKAVKAQPGVKAKKGVRSTLAGEKYVPGEVLVKFKSGTSTAKKNSLKKSLGSTKGKSIGRKGLEKLKVRKGISVDEAIKEYKGHPGVEHVQPNYIYHLAATSPNDPGYSSQWGLENTGQLINSTPGTYDADIDECSQPREEEHTGTVHPFF